MEYLINHDVNNIPQELSKIDYSVFGGTSHRSYTHRGWDYLYINDLAHWDIRKQLLINTIGTVFDFQSDKKKQESFSAIIYYIHIIGDHLDDTSYQKSNGFKIEIGGQSDRNDIINELIKHIKIVFKDQQNTHKYSALIATLESINSRYSLLFKSEGGINTDEKFQKKQQLTKNLVNTLKYYIPDMLKEESFFEDVFY